MLTKNVIKLKLDFHPNWNYFGMAGYMEGLSVWANKISQLYLLPRAYIPVTQTWIFLKLSTVYWCTGDSHYRILNTQAKNILYDYWVYL